MSTVKEMLELLEVGTKMGMKDEALQQFVKDEQARMRDEREKHRVERQEERDQEERDRDFKLQMEKERAAREHDEREHARLREHDEREHARLIEEKRHQQKLEELELDHKLQLERSHMKPSVVTKEEKETSQVIKGPKLPPFEDSKDNIDAYIQRFEIYATTQKWNKDTWGTHLSALLKGKALDVFARLSPETALDFNELKNALLKRFDMTEDGFRKKFRFSKPDGSETFMQFSTRLDSYLERWIQLSKTNKTFDDLKDLFLREQFLLCCSKELALFLKERIPTSIQDMARYADQFAEARTVTSSSLTQKPLFDRRQQSDRQPPYKDSVQQNQSGNAVKCYECGRQGHKAFNCNFRKSPNNRPFNSSEKQETTPKHTYPSDFQRGSYNNGNHGYPGRGRGRQGAASVVEKHGNLPCVGDSVAFCETEMPVVKGCVGNKLVTVLRDTGCSGAVIRRELVNDDQLTGTSQRCKLADGRIIDSDVARIDVDTPYFTGSVDAWCFDSPSYDLILGNIRGVRKPHEPNPAWIHSVENIAAVETRAQLKKKQSPYKPLKVPEAIRDVSPEDILQEQRNDETLKKLWSLAESGQLKHFSDGGFSKMCERKQMLFREFCSPKVSSGKLFRQLIVPRKYRTIVMKIAHETLMGGHLGSKKTTDRVVSEFYWPGIQSDIRRFCRSCGVCQRTIPKGKVPAVPLGQMDYKIDMGGKLKTFHANLLKKYVERDTLNCGVLSTCAISLIDFSDLDDDEQQDSILMPPVTQTETAKDIKFADRLTPDQLETAKSLCDSFSDVFTDIPGMTNLVEHKIVVTSSEPVRVKPYPIPFSTEKTITEEVQKMLQLNVIEPSSSPYSAPVVIARKKDGTNRFCIDYRRLNCATVFDAEPMPSPESIFSKMTGKKFVSKIDLSKGYWQVPMADESKPLTAFSTPSGLYQFRTMPFGLVNAPATFSRMMRKLLQGMNGVENFIDDVIVFTDTFEEHLHILKTVFERLRDAGLTARPTKCFIGFDKIDCLGHMVGNKCLEPEQDKIDAVRNAPIPQTKKQVRAFLGLAGFYRKFIPNFSAIAIPLSDLTKKGQPNKVIWTESQQRAFDTLKHMLSERPILKLPEFNETFILRTDAADDGIGAVLLQMEDDEKLPVAYASRKLQPREKAYAVIEKECLAVVWGIQKFHQYLYGREFLLETDHQPLTYLNKAKTENSRLMRWALQLQPYRFRIIAIKGSDNVGADYLSRQ
ncbi:uncharacterized protein LOC128182536 [Crassostrea angulata]|uniref:uncharacterized protein LOC128182536 n=1 Tax=Magallana angulata TaxID=2784310 RepID=UPI0022B1757E|nr:uncharacterized protein LOC128182536 [Crassostrea angulata]